VPTVLTAALVLATTGIVIEALLFRGLFDLGRELGLTWQRFGAMGATLVFVTALLFLEFPITAGVLRFGRRLEARLRMTFLEKIPRLSDRYFHSRLISDMAERSHTVHTLRLLPELVRSVRIAGHTILEGINLAIEAGSHVAIVGQSGAGKSSLVGILLGWHRPATGQVLVDGEPLDGWRLERLRRETAWVDPAVQLWNRSLLENLRYGALPDSFLPLGRVIEAAALRDVVEKLPAGLQTPLGEGGALVSGGEGQRVRLGRSLLRSGSRLVILDEPFRGLDRERRKELLARARKWWRDATFLCITHDVGETLTFNHVLVVEAGRIVEAGVPADLAKKPGSHYRAMLEAEEAVRQGLWSSITWRRLWLKDGRLSENRQKKGG